MIFLAKMKIALLYTILFGILCSRVSSILAEVDCKSLGFNSELLPCSVCDKLSKIVGDTNMSDECQRCCFEEQSTLYELAVLECDSSILPRFENVASVVKVADKLNLVFRDRMGARPTLLMYAERTDGEPAEIINIARWTADVITEYLNAHVKK